MKKKYSNNLIHNAHTLAFRNGEPHKEVARRLKITNRQLRYVLYKLKPKPTIDEMFINHFEQDIERSFKLLRKEKELTITESFLDFFTLEEYK